MNRITNAFLVGVAPVALIAAGPAFAQTAPSTASNPAPTAADTPQDDSNSADIVVTANRQGAQSLQSVPLAIQAFSGEQLERRGVRETGDLIANVPGASLGEQVGSVIKTYNIRGVGSAGGVGDTPIGYYIDNVPFAIPNFPLAPPVRFIDLDRVEVLRGPQGTLYGQGSAGGTIIFHTRDPDLNEVTFRGEANVSSTRDAGALNYGVQGAVSVPLVPGSLALRVSGGYDKRAGYVDVYDGALTGQPRVRNANDITNRDIRAVLFWKPSDTFSLRAQVWHFEPRQDYTQSITRLDPPALGDTGGIKGFENGNFDLYSLSAEYDAGFATLTSSTSYLDAQFGYLAGSNFGPLGFGSLVNDYDAYSFAQEVQLRSNGSAPFHWLLGGFYQKGRGTFAFDANTVPIKLSGFNTTRTENYSVFGEISYDLLGGKLVPLVGIRYYHDDRTLEAQQSLNGTAIPDAGASKPNKVTWRVNLSYHPSESVTAFATVSTGFRVGITQTAAQKLFLQLDGLPAASALQPDSLTNYEAGIKARMFDKALLLGLNAYRIDFKDLQFGLTTTAGVNAFANVGKARTTGVDLEASWRTPLPGFNLSAVANWNDSKFIDTLPLVTAQLPALASGKRLSNTAKFNYRFDADLDRPIGGELRFFAHGSASIISSRIMSDGYRVDGYPLFDANAGIRTGRWELGIFAENIGDERGPAFVRNSLLFAGPTPRTIGLRLRLNTK